MGARATARKWWAIPIEGGEQRRFSDAGGNGVTAYASNPAGDWIAYVEHAHSSACAGLGRIIVSTPDTLGGIAFSPPISEDDAAHDRYVAIRGMTWSPDGRYLIYGVQPYTCADAASGRELCMPAIYIIDVRAKIPGTMAQPLKIAAGSFPVWVGQ